MSDTRRKVKLDSRMLGMVQRTQRGWICDECRERVPMSMLATHVLTHPDHVGYAEEARHDR